MKSALTGRLVNMVISRLRPPGDGDIVVPQRNLSIIGTTQRLAADPDRCRIPPGEVPELLRLAAGERGVKRCRRALECSRVCPAGVYPARHIEELRRRLERKLDRKL